MKNLHFLCYVTLWGWYLHIFYRKSGGFGEHEL
jgi:hypothetical protein